MDTQTCHERSKLMPVVRTTYNKQSGSMNQEVCLPATASVKTAPGDIIANEIQKLPDLERSTAMFGRLAENSGNAMAQILYGLALRFVSEIQSPLLTDSPKARVGHSSQPFPRRDLPLRRCLFQRRRRIRRLKLRSQARGCRQGRTCARNV